MKGLTLIISSSMVAHAMDGGNKPATIITESADDTVTVTTYSEYVAGNRARCDGTALRTKTCWQDEDGTMFRYGCVEDDTKVLTDECDSNCENCAGEWKWAGETSDLCYDDGSVLYSFNCGSDTPATPIPMMPVTPSAGGGSEKSCEDLGWTIQGGSKAVCGYSKVNQGDCGTGSYAEAEAMCASVGARLCSTEELSNDETKGTGCKGDCKRVWASDTCASGHHSLAGASKCAGDYPPECTSDNEELVVRCCADVGGGSASSSSGYPEGFSAAVAKDYRIEDGSCGVSAAIAQYSCWTDPVNKKSYRFACSNSDSFVYHQECGSDKTCDDSSCSGNWEKMGEVTDQCYSRGADYLYHYQCPK